jgi:hypothetical protein
VNPRLVLVLTLAIVPLTVGAQSHPDFSGTWVRQDSTAERPSVAAVGDAAFRRGDMGGWWGSPLTVAQGANQLIVEYPYFATYDLQPPLRFVFPLDGAESRNVMMIGHAQSVLRSRAAWRDSSLVITTVFPGHATEGTTTEVRQSLTLASPTTLILETTRTGSAGRAPASIRTTYIKR